MLKRALSESENIRVPSLFTVSSKTSSQRTISFFRNRIRSQTIPNGLQVTETVLGPMKKVDSDFCTVAEVVQTIINEICVDTTIQNGTNVLD